MIEGVFKKYILIYIIIDKMNLVKTLNDQYEEIKINTPYITLGQLIKLANIFESGGMIKGYLKDEGALVNKEIEHRRGRKLYVNDIVEIKQAGTYIVREK